MASVADLEALPMPTLVLLLVALLVLPPAAAAQRAAPVPFPSYHAPWGESRGLEARNPGEGRPAPRTAGEGSDGELILAGVLGGLGTFWLSAYIGSRLHGTPCEDCGLEEGLYGAAIGFGLGSAGGVHLANDRRGPFGKSALIGMAIGAAGTVAAIETDEWRLLLAIPIAQIASAITIERGRPRE
ncbi:MAG TPA: hypothetical protein VEB59_11505 [Gemmatimonadales bacterium]|nr:hypothetical protein [Gemmatimonadales bacterium]